MQNKEKIYISTIVVLSILLILKSKKKPITKECVCPTVAPNYVPIYVPAPIAQNPQVNQAVLADASVYSGPDKFQVPESQGADKGMMYYVEGTKFYKISYISGSLTSSFTPSEITKTEMINAWNLVKPI